MRSPRRVIGLTIAALVLAAVAPGCRGGATEPAATPSASPPRSPAASGSPVACSASRLSRHVEPQEGLPAPVRQMRADLAEAAVACDYRRLGTTLADRNGKGVNFTFGPSGDSPAFWREEETTSPDPPMFALRTVLGLTHGMQRLDNGQVLYAWPAAFTHEHPSDAELAEIAEAGLYPLTTLKEWADTGNGYLGYRVVIAENGDWLAFVAGD